MLQKDFPEVTMPFVQQARMTKAWKGTQCGEALSEECKGREDTQKTITFCKPRRSKQQRKYTKGRAIRLVKRTDMHPKITCKQGWLLGESCGIQKKGSVFHGMDAEIWLFHHPWALSCQSCWIRGIYCRTIWTVSCILKFSFTQSSHSSSVVKGYKQKERTEWAWSIYPVGKLHLNWFANWFLYKAFKGPSSSGGCPYESVLGCTQMVKVKMQPFQRPKIVKLYSSWLRGAPTLCLSNYLMEGCRSCHSNLISSINWLLRGIRDLTCILQSSYKKWPAMLNNRSTSY